MNIIVTGASRGIGYEVVKKFALDQGNKVLVISRNEKKLKELRENCMQELPGSDLVLISFDLENTEQIKSELFKKIRKNMQSVDILINNAGLLINKPVWELSVEDVSRMLKVNHTAAMFLINSLMPLLEKSRKGAHVVNIGSMAGVPGGKKFAGLSAYSSSKAAVHILTECLAEEYSESGVKFNALAFGAVQTEMLAEAFPGMNAPLEPHEMASFVQEFSLNGNKYFNGKILPVSLSTP